MSEAKASVALTAEQLKDVLATVLEEARKPVMTEEDRKRIEAAQEARREGAELEVQRRTNAKRNIELCGHMKAFPWNQQTCAVYIKGCGDPGSGNFFLCQHCQARIHPGQPIPGFAYDSVRDVFDTDEFNRLWRVSQVSGVIG